MENILYSLLYIPVILILGVWSSTFFVMVREKTYKTTVLFGSKFHRILRPGFHVKWPFPIESVDVAKSTRIAELPVEAKSLTKDKATISMHVKVQYQPEPAKLYEAAYALDDAESQIQSYIENTIRSQVTKMDVDEVFSSTAEFEAEIKNLLEERFKDYGYDIVNVLIDQPQLSGAMEQAYERKLIAVREQEAATAEGEAVRIKMEARANAEGKSLIIKAESFKEFRRLIAEGNAIAIQEFLKDVDDKSLTAKDVIDFFAGVDERDALRDAAHNGGKVVFIAGRGDKGGALRDLIAANEAAEAAPGKPALKKAKA